MGNLLRLLSWIYGFAGVFAVGLMLAGPLTLFGIDRQAPGLILALPWTQMSNLFAIFGRIDGVLLVALGIALNYAILALLAKLLGDR